MAFTFFSLLPEDPIEPLEETEAVLGSGVLFVPDREGGDSPLRAGGGGKRCSDASRERLAQQIARVFTAFMQFTLFVCVDGVFAVFPFSRKLL